MASRRGARATARRARTRRIRAAGLLVVVAAIAAAFGWQLPSSSSSSASPIHVRPKAPPPTLDEARRERRGALGEAGGAVPDGTTVFDDRVPAVANLDPALLQALRRAAADAAATGVELVVDSGWRSPAYQRRLLDEAVWKYGSEAEAARWVATPDTLRTCRGTRSTSGPPMPQRGSRSTAPRTGCARSMPTSPGTTSCAPRPAIAGALRRTPTPRTTRGCSGVADPARGTERNPR